jgi:hypothetical protein
MAAYFDGMSASQIEKLIGFQAAMWRQSAGWQKTIDFRNYYAGDQPSMLSERQEDYLGDILTHSEHAVCFNVCALVIDTLRRRLKVEGFLAGSNESNALSELAWQWWQAGNMDVERSTVHLNALRDGKGYLIVDWDDQDQRPVWKANLLYDGETGVTFHRDGETGKPIMAIKYWKVSDPLSDDFAQLRRTVYLPDRLMRYEMNKGGEWQPLDERKGKSLEWWTDTLQPGGKPLGLPVIEFRNPGGMSELKNVIGLQNTINKFLLDLLAAGDNTGFQILALLYPGPMGPTVPDDEGEDDSGHSDELRIAPGRAIELYDGADIKAIAAGDISQLIDGLTTLVSFVSASSGTPHYYLRPTGGGEVPSGEALKQLESALVARAQERFLVFGASWVEAVRVAARLWVAMGGRDADPEAPLEVSWGDPQIKNELYQAQVATAEAAIGIPNEVLWSKRLDYSPEEVANMRVMNQAAEAEKIANVIGALGRNGTEQGTSGNGRSGAANA